MDLSYSVLVFLLNVLISTVGVSGKETYKGDIVIRVIPTKPNQLEWLQKLYSTTNVNDGIDFWTDPIGLNIPVAIHIKAGSDVITLTKLKEMKLSPKVVIHDVEHYLNHQSKKRRRKRETEEGFSFSVYHTYSEIMNWTLNRRDECPRGLDCTVTKIGQSYERRDIIVLKFGVPGKNKTALFFDCGMHSREWISPATCLYLINSYIEGFREGDDVITDILTTWDIHVVPILNPDGYNYSWTDERLWRKTRTPNNGTKCVGTDPNRNWNFHWIAKNDPCSIVYPGPKPFSEPCVRAVADHLLSLENVMIYINIHSYVQMWLPSWGYTTELPDDYQDLHSVAVKAAAAMKDMYGTDYLVGISGELLSSNGGMAKDWAKGVAGVKYTYTLELRDRNYGFLLPEEEIIPTGIETFHGFEAMLKEVERIENI